MLEIKNLTKKFGTKIAVDSVSFTIKAGEIFTLIGPNGSGKTTTIKIIAGLLRPSEGTVTVDGFDVTAQPTKAKTALGYIPDEPSIWPGMTGEEFLHFSGSLYGMDRAARERKIKELLADFSLEGIERDYFENYSRGNKQKFTIIAALMHSPKLLLVDEPIVGLDPTSAETAKEKFEAFAHAGGAILLATHTLTFAEKIADTIGILAHGKLLAQGNMAAVRSQAELPTNATLEDIYHAITKQ